MYTLTTRLIIYQAHPIIINDKLEVLIWFKDSKWRLSILRWNTMLWITQTHRVVNVDPQSA